MKHSNFQITGDGNRATVRMTIRPKDSEVIYLAGRLWTVIAARSPLPSLHRAQAAWASRNNGYGFWIVSLVEVN